MNILILDDEQSARANVRYFLENSGLNISNILEAASVKEAEEIIQSFQPDTMFLDINLPDGLSFDFLLRLPAHKKQCKIIFISAYDEYAIKAFRFSAVDYLLKPINPSEFDEVLKKIQEGIHDQHYQLQQLNDDLRKKHAAFNRIALKDQHSVHFVDIPNIVLCQSQNTYTLFKLLSGEQLLITKTLKSYETLLTEKGFFRPHKTALINLQHVKKYDKRDGGVIVMKDNSQIPLSRFKKEIFLKILSSM